MEESNTSPRERNNEEKRIPDREDIEDGRIQIPNEVETSKTNPINNKPSSPSVPKVPYPRRLRKDKMEQSFKDIYDVLSKVTINLPLLDAIQKMPAYGKFFKELNKEKYQFRPKNQERLDENASAVI